MGKYFKRFENHSQYEQYIQSENYIKPNISICNNGQEVHYNSLFVHDYVDLGLPSGTLWATENIKDVNGNELYFAWGETIGYTAAQVGVDKNFSNIDYVFGRYSNLKYNDTDGKTILDAEDDAATVNWGADWCMPTKEQFDEIMNEDYTTIVFNVNKKEAVITSKLNGKSLIFTNVGYAYQSNILATPAQYWSCSLYNRYKPHAYMMIFYCDDGNTQMFNTYNSRYAGCSVRPVRANN